MKPKPSLGVFILGAAMASLAHGAPAEAGLVRADQAGPAAGSSGAAEPFRYEGVCEASAASILDGDHFAVASDETAMLTIYRRRQASPVGHLAVAADVSDIEAAARIGDTIFWLTSHSLSNSGGDPDKRKLLFATTVAGGHGLSVTNRVHGDLRQAVASRLGLAEDGLKASLNIEGLAATPHGNLLVGLRAPLTADGRARVVRIDNPFGLLGLPAPPAAGPDPVAPVSEIDLGGRGIRSIEQVGSGARYLIVAGPVEDQGLPPALFWWDGAGAPTSGPTASFDGVTPEALIAWSDRDLQILGDNGAACSDEEENPRWFPSIDVGG